MTTSNQAAETSKPAVNPVPDDGHKQDNKPAVAPNQPETKK